MLVRLAFEHDVHVGAPRELGLEPGPSAAARQALSPAARIALRLRCVALDPPAVAAEEGAREAKTHANANAAADRGGGGGRAEAAAGAPGDPALAGETAAETKVGVRMRRACRPKECLPSRSFTTQQ